MSDLSPSSTQVSMEYSEERGIGGGGRGRYPQEIGSRSPFIYQNRQMLKSLI